MLRRVYDGSGLRSERENVPLSHSRSVVSNCFGMQSAKFGGLIADVSAFVFTLAGNVPSNEH